MTATTTRTPGPSRERQVEKRTHGRAVEVWLAVTRVGVGFIFLWAFLDKMLGLGYATPAARAVVNGGSPTKGFLTNVKVGPLQDLFHAMAGNVLVDVLFMAALLGIGLALVLGVALRIAAVSTGILMIGMWAAEWPMATVTADGRPSGSNNPFMDYHLAYGLIVVLLAYLAVGSAYGLGRWWSRLPIVRRHRALL